MSIRKSIVAFVTLTLFSTSCGVEIHAEATPTQAPLMITAALPVTPTDLPSETPLPAPPQPMATRATPVEGMTSTQINVRAEPSTASTVLGMIPANTKVEITGKNPGESWWQINYPQGIDGKGWVTAQYITTGSKPEVPVIGGNESSPNSGNVAIVQQQLNVRSGPGTSFNSLGTLNPQDVVSLVGKDSNGAWLQINYAVGPEGKGWVNAAFVQAEGVNLSGLPIVTEAGQVVGTGTPTGIPPTPTQTLIPAWEDNDSANQPIASIIFEPTGTQTFIYNGDLSSPQGDAEDWISFKPDNTVVFASLECKGNESLKLEMTENNLPVNVDIACGDQMKKIAVNAGSNYLVHLQTVSLDGSFQYTHYMLTIKSKP